MVEIIKNTRGAGSIESSGVRLGSQCLNVFGVYHNWTLLIPGDKKKWWIIECINDTQSNNTRVLHVLLWTVEEPPTPSIMGRHSLVIYLLDFIRKFLYKTDHPVRDTIPHKLIVLLIGILYILYVYEKWKFLRIMKKIQYFFTLESLLRYLIIYLLLGQNANKFYSLVPIECHSRVPTVRQSNRCSNSDAWNEYGVHFGPVLPTCRFSLYRADKLWKPFGRPTTNEFSQGRQRRTKLKLKT